VTKTILVTGANGDIGDAIGRILAEARPDWRRIGADPAGEWPGRDVFPIMRFLPFARDPRYASALATLIRAESIDRTVLITDPELERYSADPALSDLPVVANAGSVLATCQDKLRTIEWLSSLGLPALDTVPLVDARAIGAPVIVKPRRGHGSRGLAICRDDAGLARRIAEEASKEDFVAQRLIGGDDDEYTCALVKLLGQVRRLTLRRWLFGNQTGRCEVASIAEIDLVLDRIAEALPDGSFINVQLRLVHGRPWVFEINPRFSSTVMMRHRIGFSDFVWTLDAFEGIRPPPYRPPVGRRIYRLSREVVAPPEPR
jgi:carbamoyl-phosphate synthase large subunit